MRKLSFWARRHPWTARFSIVICHILLIWLALVLAKQLFFTGIQLSPLWIYLFTGIFIITCFVYPSKKPGFIKSKWHYAKQKTGDFIIGCCGFCLVCGFANQLWQPLSSSVTARAAIVITKKPVYKNPEAERLLKAFTNGEKQAFSKKEKRIIKDEFKYQLAQYAKAKLTGDKKGGDQTALIILTCIVAVGLIYLLAAIACNLSCSGSDAAAVIVLVVGLAAIIWGMVVIMRRINRGPRKAAK